MKATLSKKLKQARARIAELEERLAYTDRGELGNLLGVNGVRISQLVREGVLVVDATGKYPRETNTLRICQHLLSKMDLTHYRREGLKAKAELLSIAVAKARGEVLDRREVDQFLSGMLITCRTRLLRIGNKLAPRLVFCRSENEFETAIDDEVREALFELSRTPPYQSTAQPTAEPQPQGS